MGRHMNNTALSPTTCTRCHQPIAAGWDAPMAALHIRLNPWPATPLAEILALHAGRGSYTAQQQRNGEIHASRRNKHNSEINNHPVWLEHECGDTPPPRFDIDSVFTPPALHHDSLF